MTTPPSIAPVSPTRRRIVALLAALALLVVPFVAGYEAGHSGSSSTEPAAASFGPESFTPSNQLPGANGSGGSGSSSGSSVSPGTTGQIDVAAITDKLDDSIVNIRVSYGTNGEAAGTGIVISSSGLVLTNNHVIADAQDVQVEFASTGATKAAKVLGYSPINDVALIQIQGVSGLTAAELSDSTTLSVGDPIIALGNAGGRGGEPTVVAGNVTALDQEITAADADGSNVQTLNGLIQVDANIQPGDSGGPMVNANGAVVGMTAAASVNNGGFRFPSQTTNQGYAIPIESAFAIAKKITTGASTADIHVGSERGVLGVQVQADSGTARRGQPGDATGNGAVVLGVDGSSGAGKAGIVAGDVITAVDGRTITSGSDLTKAMVRYGPGDNVQVTWTDSSGNSQHATVKLGSGTPS